MKGVAICKYFIFEGILSRAANWGHNWGQLIEQLTDVTYMCVWKEHPVTDFSPWCGSLGGFEHPPQSRSGPSELDLTRPDSTLKNAKSSLVRSEEAKEMMNLWKCTFPMIYINAWNSPLQRICYTNACPRCSVHDELKLFFFFPRRFASAFWGHIELRFLSADVCTSCPCHLTSPCPFLPIHKMNFGLFCVSGLDHCSFGTAFHFV